ncbi:acyl carrier protein [Mangrovihabitans endophyticus]|uniref:Acyl carrier protein n=1 Tax=Mangrovihabitans endophyticus TaxID=1751298 RepID=A0A8J3BVR3_9ACTN|nr:acyl carrier protein [Mangrovihabitans endophyticus]GGK73792.1 hypothetical protein GCM10012284_04630 [Mangrovihabitans endophyticus]
MTSSAVPSPADVRSRTRDALRQRLGPLDTVPDETPLPDALGPRYDSLTALECIGLVEAEFGIEVDFIEHDVRHAFRSIAAITGFVHDLLEDQASLRAHR